MDLVYTNFILTNALKAIDGDQQAQKWFRLIETRLGIKAYLELLEREITALEPQEPNIAHVIELILAATPEAKRDAMKALREWLHSATQIDFVDPYLLSKVASWGAAEIASFAEDFVSILPRGVTVNVFVNGYNNEVRATVWRKIKEGRTARLIQTDRYHDRFIVTDSGVKLMGASFNGLGRKISALVDLDDKDAKEIRAGVLRERLAGTKLAGPGF